MRPELAWSQCQEPRPSSGPPAILERPVQDKIQHTRKLVNYFHVLNSGDEADWEVAFEATWHPDAIVQGRRLSVLKDRHRRRLGGGPIEHIHVFGNIDAHQVQYVTESDGKREGPYIATFRDGRIYRIV